ncbi:hydrogenase maturation nickel metallochaperone HypA [Bacillota bacterium LX-D]|nr:hydrogenase maturation nickel metallochaperone HypA [Bacillota bacterium LX-D]
MHEYPITEQIVRIAEESARNNNAEKVVAINLVVGELSGFIGDSIQMYFDIISKGTIVEGAQLNIRYIKPKLKCEKCDIYFTRPKFSFACPQCGANGVPTEIGKEFFVEDIEIALPST